MEWFAANVCMLVPEKRERRRDHNRTRAKDTMARTNRIISSSFKILFLMILLVIDTCCLRIVSCFVISGRGGEGASTTITSFAFRGKRIAGRNAQERIRYIDSERSRRLYLSNDSSYGTSPEESSDVANTAQSTYYPTTAR